MNTILDANPIGSLNLSEYMRNVYKVDASPRKTKFLKFTHLLQRDYGQSGDCAITSIAACVYYYTKQKIAIEKIYDRTECIAKQYGYNGEKWGTFTTTIKAIYEKTLKAFEAERKTHWRTIKGIGFNAETIKQSIDNDCPVILSLRSDGRSYYKNHTVAIIGYEYYEWAGKHVYMFAIADNWSKNIRYVDYNRMKVICLNY